MENELIPSEKLEKKYEFHGNEDYIDKTLAGYLFKVSPELIALMPADENNWKEMKKEYFLNLEAKRNGIALQETEGQYRISNKEKETSCPGIIYKKSRGTLVSKLGMEEKEEAKRRYLEESRKAEEIGFNEIPFSENNAYWDGENIALINLGNENISFYTPKRLELTNLLRKGKELGKKEAEALGNISKTDENFPFKYSVNQNGFLNFQGNNSKIYHILADDSLIAKFPSGLGNIQDMIEANEMQEDYFQSKINVAKPEGIFNVYNEKTKDFKPAFVMKFVPGKNGEQLDPTSKQYQRAKDLARIEARKMKEKGHVFYYEGVDEFSPLKKANVLYNEETDSVTIIDFDFEGKIKR